MREGNFVEACPKLEESQRLDPKGGTLLNLAVCHQRVGKKATAWTEYRQALAQAVREGRPRRVELARARLEELDSELSRIVVIVPAPARLDGLVIRLNGTAHRSGRLGFENPSGPRCTHCRGKRAEARELDAFSGDRGSENLESTSAPVGLNQACPTIAGKCTQSKARRNPSGPVGWGGPRG